MSTSGPPVYPLQGPVAARRGHGPVRGYGGSSNPGGPSGGGGFCSTAGIYYSLQDISTGSRGVNLGPFIFPQIQGSGVIGTTTVGNDVWNPVLPLTQALYVNDPAWWTVIANFPSGNAAVSSYPSNSQAYSNPGNHALPFLLNAVTSFYSYFNETQANLPGVISEAAYDTWWNSSANEIMIQHDMVDPSGDRGSFETIDLATFGGTGGVPVQQWSLGIFGSEIIWQLTSGTGLFGGGVSQGTVDIRSMVNWLADRGYMVNALNSDLVTIGYGWEICSTGGVDALYRLNGFWSSFTYSTPETSPGLELSGFAISGPGPADTVNSVTVTVTEYQSDLAMNPCQIQLWDYSGTPAQIGSTRYGQRSTSTANTSQATFYTVSYAQLATLRVRVYGWAAAGYTESVGGVALNVNYTPGAAAPPVPVPAGMSNRAVTVPVRIG